MRDKTIDKLVRAAVAAAVTGVAGCGDILSLEGYEDVPCDLGLSTLPETQGADFAVLPGTGGIYSGPSAQFGEPCLMATDMTACLEAVDEAYAQYDRAIVTTTGDDVQTFQVSDTLMPIETIEQAMLWATYNGYGMKCGNLEDGAFRVIDEDFYLVGTKYANLCPIDFRRYRIRVNRDGSIVEIDDEIIEEDSNSCIGRRPPGLVAALNTISDPVARFWSTVAHLEQSAVIAFRLLAKELEAFGAPAELIERAVAAAEDEVRHAIQTRAIAERMGGVWIEPEVEELEDRSLLDFAIDNATEGCVRETFGAAVGRFQACVAEDDEVRRVMKQVGEDETRHAELSWDIAVWCDSQLTEEEQAQVQRAQRLAYVDLVSACHAPIPVALARQAGYPGPQHALRLVNGMKTLWV